PRVLRDPVERQVDQVTEQLAVGTGRARVFPALLLRRCRQLLQLPYEQLMREDGPTIDDDGLLVRPWPAGSPRTRCGRLLRRGRIRPPFIPPPITPAATIAQGASWSRCRSERDRAFDLGIVVDIDTGRRGSCPLEER